MSAWTGTPFGRVPQPAEWVAVSKTRYVLIVLVFGLLTIGGIAVAVSALGPGRYDPRSGIIILATPLFAGVAVDVLLSRLLTRTRGSRAIRTGWVTEVGQDGLLVPYSATLTVIHIVVAVISLVLFAGLGVAAIMVLASEGISGHISYVVIALVCVVFVASLLASAVLLAGGKLRRGLLAITSDGVYHRSWSFSAYAAWDAIMYVDAAEVNGPIIQLATTETGDRWYRRRTRLRRQPELAFQPHIGIQARLLSAEPALVYQTLRFYQQNPAARIELGTDTALQRVRHGDVVASG